MIPLFSKYMCCIAFVTSVLNHKSTSICVHVFQYPSGVGVPLTSLRVFLYKPQGRLAAGSGTVFCGLSLAIVNDTPRDSLISLSSRKGSVLRRSLDASGSGSRNKVWYFPAMQRTGTDTYGQPYIAEQCHAVSPHFHRRASYIRFSGSGSVSLTPVASHYKSFNLLLGCSPPPGV